MLLCMLFHVLLPKFHSVESSSRQFMSYARVDWHWYTCHTLERAFFIFVYRRAHRHRCLLWMVCPMFFIVIFGVVDDVVTLLLLLVEATAEALVAVPSSPQWWLWWKQPSSSSSFAIHICHWATLLVPLKRSHFRCRSLCWWKWADSIRTSTCRISPQSPDSCIQ